MKILSSFLVEKSILQSLLFFLRLSNDFAVSNFYVRKSKKLLSIWTLLFNLLTEPKCIFCYRIAVNWNNVLMNVLDIPPSFAMGLSCLCGPCMGLWNWKSQNRRCKLHLAIWQLSLNENGLFLSRSPWEVSWDLLKTYQKIKSFRG